MMKVLEVFLICFGSFCLGWFLVLLLKASRVI